MTIVRMAPSQVVRSPVVQIAVAATLIGSLYLHWTPLVPDLAAQVARANVVHHNGITSWWTGWFGGLSLPTYSVLVPAGMAVFGVRVIGLVAVLLGAAATTILARDALRPRAGALAFAVSGFADLLNGRVTFAVGLAFAAWALVELRGHRPITTIGLSVAAYCASPLAGLFLGLLMLAVAIADAGRRRTAIWAGAGLMVIAVSMALMFPGTGTMPFTLLEALPAAMCCLGVLVVCPQRLVRTAAAIVLTSLPVVLILPGAVGNNITRLAWVAAVPLIIACAPLPRRLLVLVVAAAAIWPLADLAGQLYSATDTSAQASFYSPLRAELQNEQQHVGADAIGQRVEVVDTVNHWGSVYLSAMSLARGWDRQADHTYNPMFYDGRALDATAYRRWLDQLAVGWVALPAAPLDYAAVQEAALLHGGLNYLTLTWSSRDWKLYRVDNSVPLVRGGQLRSVDSSGVTFATTAAAAVTIQMRWSPYLRASDKVTGLAVAECIGDADGWVSLQVPRAGTFEVSSEFDPAARLSGVGPVCSKGT